MMIKIVEANRGAHESRNLNFLMDGHFRVRIFNRFINRLGNFLLSTILHKTTKYIQQPQQLIFQTYYKVVVSLLISNF